MREPVSRRAFLRAGAAALALAATPAALAEDTPAAASGPCDLVLRGGTVIDGTGKASAVADVGVTGGRITAVGPDLAGKEQVDCAGKLVCPGFVDIHTHLDMACFPAAVDRPLEPGTAPLPEAYARMLLEQGITTVLSGNCGYSAPDVAAHLAALETAGLPFHYATLAGHASLRTAARSAEGPGAIAAALREALDAGAFGLSVNLATGPSSEASPGEFVLLSRTLGGAEGSLLAVHRRDEGANAVAATREVLDLAQAGGARLQISHMRCRLESGWGAAEEALALVASAVQAGQDVAADIYANTGGAMTLPEAYLPPDLRTGDYRVKLTARRADPDLAAAVGARFAEVDPVFFFPRTKAYEGFYDLSLVDIALARSTWATPLSPQDMVLDIAIADTGTVAGTVIPTMGLYVAEVLPDQIVDALKQPFVMLASDAGGPASGDVASLCPWFFSNTVAALWVFSGPTKPLTYEQTVHKMSGQPAARLGLRDRGVLAPGASADVVVIDPARLQDLSLPGTPHARPRGIDRVYVEGKLVVEKGAWGGAKHGRVLRHGK
jgi:N-acyl-D-amino-acid deacylase